MKLLLTAFAFLGVLLSSCATQRRISDTLIDYEAAGHSKERICDAYTMRDLICALDNSFWELHPTGRGSWVDEHYPSGVPHDFIVLPESGAQCALTATRLDKDVLAVVSNSQMVDGSSSIRVLRRIPGGWIELTSRAFPYRLASDARIEAKRDKSVIVRHTKSGASEKYVWRGSQFVPA